MTHAETQSVVLSIVVPAFNEETNIRELYKQIRQNTDPLARTWELIIVDDGSTDGTWREIVKLHLDDTRVKGVRLSRNFGHQYALMAGIEAARGDAVISADADLQHPPALIPDLVRAWDDGYQIVHTIRQESQDLGFFKRITSKIFYSVFRYFSGVPIEAGMADYRLLDRNVVDDIVKFEEQGLFLRGIVQWVGYRSTALTYRPAERYSGSTKYSFKKMIKLAWHGVSSFSNVPLRVGVSIGLIASVIAFGGVGYAMYSKFITGQAIPGWASSVAIISFLFATLFVYLGLLGEYIGRIMIEVRRRPRFLVSDTLGLGGEDTGARRIHDSRIVPEPAEKR